MCTAGYFTALHYSYTTTTTTESSPDQETCQLPIYEYNSIGLQYEYCTYEYTTRTAAAFPTRHPTILPASRPTQCTVARIERYRYSLHLPQCCDKDSTRKTPRRPHCSHTNNLTWQESVHWPEIGQGDRKESSLANCSTDLQQHGGTVSKLWPYPTFTMG